MNNTVDAIDFLAEVAPDDARRLLSLISPQIQHVLDFTDGKGTRHVLAAADRLLAKLCPAALVIKYEEHTDSGDWSHAEDSLRAYVQQGVKDGWPGSTTIAYSNPSATSRLQRLRQTTTGNSPVKPSRWRPDLNQMASTIPGAIHSLPIIPVVRRLRSTDCSRCKAGFRQGASSVVPEAVAAIPAAGNSPKILNEETPMAIKDLTPAQRSLAEFMSDLSQRAYFAGWLSGIEVELWRALRSPALRGAPLRLTPEDVDRLESLSAQCGGWIVYTNHEETFVPLTEWENKHPVT